MEIEESINNFIKDQAYIEGWYACLKKCNMLIIDELRRSDNMNIIEFGIDITKKIVVEMKMDERVKNGNKTI